MRESRRCVPAAAAMLLAASAVCAAPPAAVQVGQREETIPAWAAKELAAFEAIEANMQDFMKRFVLPDGKTIVTENCTQGTLDDSVEGFFKWDKFILLAASDDLRRKYVKVWKATWDFGLRQGIFKDGFYARGYDAEHAGELFPLLWACLELDPRDTELVRTNKACADVLTSPEWFHPTQHLFRYGWIRSQPIDEAWRKSWLTAWQGENGVNTLYVSSVWLAYLTTGEAKYRQWVLDYCAAWNAAAARNGGCFPYQIDTETGKLGPGGDGRWWKGTEKSASFDLEGYGIVTPTRGWRNLPVAAAFLDGGNPTHAAGIVGTVKVLCADIEQRLPVTHYSPEKGGWHRPTVRGYPHDIPGMVDRAYVLTWDPAIRTIIERYPVEKVTYIEQEAATWCQFTYLRKGDLTAAEQAFDRLVRQAKSRQARAATATRPVSGDDLTDLSLTKLNDLDYVDGAQWGGHNARNGGPSAGPVGYFDAAGRRGLPKGLAALVRYTDRTSAVVLLCNANETPTQALLTGGYYGQHRIDAVESGGKKTVVNAGRVLLELPAHSGAEATLTLTRCAYPPTLEPQRRPEAAAPRP
jgi:hypothetical protein